MTPLPERLSEALRAHLERVGRQHRAELDAGLGSVELPDALARKYPSATRDWAWQWVFPGSRLYTVPGTMTTDTRDPALLARTKPGQLRSFAAYPRCYAY